MNTNKFRSDKYFDSSADISICSRKFFEYTLIPRDDNSNTFIAKSTREHALIDLCVFIETYPGKLETLRADIPELVKEAVRDAVSEFMKDLEIPKKYVEIGFRS